MLFGLRAIIQAQDSACVSSAIHDSKGVTYSWSSAASGSKNSIGALVVQFGKASKVYKLPIDVVPSRDPLMFQSASCVASGTKMTSMIAFREGSRQENLLVTLSSQKDTLGIEFAGQQHFAVNFLAIATWPEELRPEPIAVPYYSFPIFRLRDPGLFANTYWDWTASNATILGAARAEYRALSDGRRNTLHEKLVVKLSTDFDEVFADIPNARSTYFSEVSGRTVIDIWGPKFSAIASTLAKLQGEGMADCIALIHVWQRAGYDNGLPEHYPANTALGGETALEDAVQAGQAAGCLVGLHENYVDYYPNSPHFDPKAIALNVKGEQQKAWFNSGVPIQSFAARPNLYVAIAKTQSPEIHRRYHTSASFLDVNSSTFPWWRADLDSSAPSAGMFSSYSTASSDLWAYERTSHAGPVFGEGKEHWFWSGLLDGVEAQLGSEDIKLDKPDYPLFVDFDLLKIHPLQVNHGMGYYNRWLPTGKTIHETALLDAYRMQEIAFGHAPFIGTELWDNIPQVLIEQNLIGSVAKRYGTSLVQAIRYQIKGVWSNTNDAVAAHDWSRVEVAYTNGDKIIANARTEPLLWEGITLPQYGWAAKGPGLLAFTGIIKGQIADYSQTADSYFANARNPKDLGYSGAVAEPKVNASAPIVDFGTLRTDGMVSLTRGKSGWLVRAYPNYRDVVVSLNAKTFPPPSTVTCYADQAKTQAPSVAGGYWSVKTIGFTYCSW